MSFDPQDIVAMQKALYAATGQMAVTSGGGVVGVGSAALHGATYAGSLVASKDATGIRSAMNTTASTSAYVGVRDGNAGYRIGWGCGSIFKFALSAVADGRCFCGYTDQTLNSCINNASFLSGRKLVGVGFDKALGHANWQFMADPSGGAHTYVDSGVALAANTPVAVGVDAIDKATVTLEIRDAANASLASHVFAAASLPAPTQDLFEGVLAATPTTGTPADRSIYFFGGWNWRRL